MPRNLFTGEGDEPVEVPQGEQSPQSEIPVENLGDLYEDRKSVTDLIEEVNQGVLSKNEARKILGLQEVEDNDILSRLEQTDQEWFDNIRRRSIEGRRDHSRWERG